MSTRYADNTLTWLESGTKYAGPGAAQSLAVNLGVDFITQAGRIADALTSLAESQATLAECAVRNTEMAEEKLAIDRQVAQGTKALEDVLADQFRGN